MAKSIEEILGKDINSIKELRQAIKELQDSIASADPTSEEFKDTTEKLVAAQDQLNSVMRAGKGDADAATDSIVGMERQYKELYNTYKLFTEEQRNSPMGKQMADDLKNLSETLNKTKQDVGNYKDNIGRYAESVMDAFSKMGGSVGGLVGPFKTATQGVNAFNQALKANPVMAVISIIMTLINVLKSLKGSIEADEESQMRMNEAMAAFQPVIDAASNALAAMGRTIVSVVEWLGKCFSKIRELKAAFTDFLGITKGAKDAVKEQNKMYSDLAKSQNELTKRKREYQKLNASDKAEVERLREEASETTNLVDKKKLLEDAAAKQAEIDNRQIEIAKQELEILQTQSELTANDAAMNDKLAAAVAKVAEAEATAATNARNFNKQLSATTSGLNKATSAAKSWREEAKELYKQVIENSKSELLKLEEKYTKEKKLLVRAGLDTTLLTKQYETERQKIIDKSINESGDKWVAKYEYIQNVNKKLAEMEREQLGDEIAKMEAQQEAVWDEYNKVEELGEKLKNIPYEIGSNEWTGMASDLVAKLNAEFEELHIEFPPDEVDKETAEAFIKSLDVVKNDAVKKAHEINNDINSALYAKIGGEGFDDELKVLEEKFLVHKLLITDGYTDFDALMREKDAEYAWHVQQNITAQLEAKKQFLEEYKDFEELSAEERLAIEQEYYDTLNEIRERDIAIQQRQLDVRSRMDQAIVGSLSSVAGALKSVEQMREAGIEADLKAGKITEQQAKKQKEALLAYEKVAQAVNIAVAVADTAAGIMGIWRGYGQEKAVNAETAAAAGPAAVAVLAGLNAKSLITAIAQTAGLAANGIAQIASIRSGTISKVSSLTDTGSSGGGAAGTAVQPAEIDTTPYTYTRTLQTQEEEDQLNRPMFVSVVDINEVQNRVKVVEEESNF